MSKINVILSAYACSPLHGSEPGVGWGFATALAKYHNVTVITEETEFRAVIEEYLDKNREEHKNLKFVFVPRKRIHFLERLWPPSYYWTYKKWQKDAFRAAVQLTKTSQFDIVHQLNMIGFREPGFLWKLGLPLVWGPIGGMGFFPAPFLLKSGFISCIFYLTYNLVNAFDMRLKSRPRIAANKARAILAVNSENQNFLKQFYDVNSEVCFAVGPPKQNSRPPTRRHASEPLSIVWAGLLIDRKALHLGLEALAMLPKDTNWQLQVLGDGPNRAKLQRLTQRLGLAERVSFLGRQSQDTTVQIMMASHLHLLTSLREGTPSVIAEAMAAGIPTISFDISGMRDMLDERSGIKIPAPTAKAAVEGLASSIQQIALDESLRYSLAEGALQRSLEFSWDSKALQVNRIYNGILK